MGLRRADLTMRAARSGLMVSCLLLGAPSAAQTPQAGIGLDIDEIESARESRSSGTQPAT